MRSNLSIASICRSLPYPDDPSSGIFVYRRLAAMAKHTSVITIQPIPYFPVVAPLPRWARRQAHEENGLQIAHAPMFYLPRFLKSLDGFWLYRSVLHRLVNLKHVGRLDVVDAHFAYPEGVGAYLAARQMKVPFFVTLRGFEAEYLHKPVIGPQIRFMIRNADGIICVSQFLKDLAVEHGALAERTKVIHNAIDEGTFFPGDRKVARQRLGLPQDDLVVITVGHLIRRKRHHVLISAFSELLKTRPDAKLLIVGSMAFETDYARNLRSLVASLGIAESVVFLGNIGASRVADYLRAANVFALGTQREGCCNAVLEALACGLPVITTPVGDNTWFVKDADNGYIVPVDDSGAMAQALSCALNRRDWHRERISGQLQVGNWDRVAAEVLDFVAEQRQ